MGNVKILKNGNIPFLGNLKLFGKMLKKKHAARVFSTEKNGKVIIHLQSKIY